MGNKKEYISEFYGTVSYDSDLLDIEDVKDMDRMAASHKLANRASHMTKFSIKHNRLQRIINHSERVRKAYDPQDPYMNMGIDPLVKPRRYLTTLAGRAGWKVRPSEICERSSPYQYKLEYIPPVEEINSIIIKYNKDHINDYDYFEPFIIKFLEINQKLMDSAVQV